MGGWGFPYYNELLVTPGLWALGPFWVHTFMKDSYFNKLMPFRSKHHSSVQQCWYSSSSWCSPTFSAQSSTFAFFLSVCGCITFAWNRHEYMFWYSLFSGEHCLQITCAGHSRRERRPVICFTPPWHSESSFCWQISCINLDINITLESEMINWSSTIGSKERSLIFVLYFAILSLKEKEQGGS